MLFYLYKLHVVRATTISIGPYVHISTLCSITKAIMPYTCILTCQARFTLGWKSAEWTRRWADLWNDLSFSLCATPSVCRMVATSDEGEKVRVEVSTDWCVTVEHWRSSSIRGYLCQLSD